MLFFRLIVASACSALFLSSCPSLPGAKAQGAIEGLEVPDGYRGGRAAIPELVESLGDVFSDSGLKKQLALAQQQNPDLAHGDLPPSADNSPCARDTPRS